MCEAPVTLAMLRCMGQVTHAPEHGINDSNRRNKSPQDPCMATPPLHNPQMQQES